MTSSFYWLSVQGFIALHDEASEDFGGSLGILNQSIHPKILCRYPASIMSTPAEVKKTSIELEITLEQKQTLEKAAALAGVTLNTYLLQQVIYAAEKKIAFPEQIVLSERDWKLLTSTLENPPEPSKTLKSAIKKHQDQYGKW